VCPSGRAYGEGAPEAIRDQCVEGTTTGRIGEWSTWGTGTPAPSRARARAGTADHLYLMGGREPGASNTYRSDMWVASIAAGTWVAAPIPASRANSAAVAWGPYVYLLGGRNAVVPGDGFADVWVSTSDAAGRPNAWTPTEPLCAGRYALAAVVANGSLYAFGGADGNLSASTTSCYAAIDPATGTLQPWAETAALPVSLRSPVVVATDDHVFLIGGCADTASATGCNDGANASADVFAAPVLPDGGLGEWRKVSTVPDASIDRGATIYDGRIYVVGGADRVWTALIEYGGALGEWAAGPPAHVVGSSARPHRRPGVSASNGQLYVFEYDDFVAETISAPLL
jgi:hypothetical protein